MVNFAYQRPENALKRAEELVAVSQHASALTLLHEVILAKRTRQCPLNVLDPIMFKFVELSVLLGRGKIAREGLHQYKNIAQNTSVIGIEPIIKRFLELAILKLDTAQKEANQIFQIDDLEASETPESIMLNTVSNEDSKDRTDRQVVTPWLKFLWEAYRTALDTLRNNSNLEEFYQKVASRAFEFCRKYDRKIEFRRLCETLRQHLISYAKNAHQPHAIDLNYPETLRRHLDIRFEQLNLATELELWQEGFRSVEDIFNLLQLSEHRPKVGHLANYYEKLSKILMIGENYLFQSAAFKKFSDLMQTKPNITDVEKTILASKFLVSALAIPIVNPQASTAFDDKSYRLNLLLSPNEEPSEKPTRESLLKSALSNDALSIVKPEIAELYKLLEVDFFPLSICQKIAPIINSFSGIADLSDYVKPLHQVILTRLLQELSKVYSSIKISSVVKLATFDDPYNYDAHDIEKFVMLGCKRGDFSIRINQKTKSLEFDSPIFSASSVQIKNHMHALPAGEMRVQLNQFAKRLEKALSLTNPRFEKEKLDEKKESFRLAAKSIELEKEAIIYRLALINRKKEVKEEEAQALELQRQQRALEAQAAEAVRLAEHEKKLAQERLLQQRKEIERNEALKMAEKIANELRDKNVKIKDDEILDTDKLIELQVQQLEKERRELAQKTKSLNKRLDHTERAFRKEEIPLLQLDYKQQQAHDEEVYKLKVKTIKTTSEAVFKKNMELKKRMTRMLDDFSALRSTLQVERDAHYAILQEEADEKIRQAKEARIKEVAAKEEERARAFETARIAAESNCSYFSYLFRS
ncbi:hypothetical protein BC833DRAFT_593138 [Globomyces pollinis-pini]|nr:hypothetical protein BC833DRAFT_593138 [Globomyces pollinis-pini]